MYIHTYIHTYVHTHLHTYTLHTYIHTYIHSYKQPQIIYPFFDPYLTPEICRRWDTFRQGQKPYLQRTVLLEFHWFTPLHTVNGTGILLCKQLSKTENLYILALRLQLKERIITVIAVISPTTNPPLLDSSFKLLQLGACFIFVWGYLICIIKSFYNTDKMNQLLWVVSFLIFHLRNQ